MIKLISLLLMMPMLGLAQPNSRTIELRLKSFTSEVEEVSVDHARRSLKIASYLLNSREVQDSISKRTFGYNNLCEGCDINHARNQPDVLGARILDSLLRKSSVDLDLLLKKRGTPPIFGYCFGLGNTCPNTNYITSFYKNIKCDMCDDLPFEYAYAVHLCHEYAHNVGYCHTNMDDDVAEAVGWIAFHFAKQWHASGVKIE